ncbi:MAG: CCA tRNA nucleotidyltransferase, partial [Patescibacteria group bacterium]|nr:CCA tRNA nucleotidyltransferase [Patescibacteria group bacterium]
MKQTGIEIIKILKDAGYQAYFAGGCVRDILLKIKPKDYDIVTSAKPEEVENILPKTYAVGKQFGVIVALFGKFKYEIATFRSEGRYLDRRRPSNVFWSSAQEDAKRRDFTINGMFYDPVKEKVVDYVGGQEDLKNKILRFIGNPNDRIKEDYLRILRAVRFKNTLGFEYDPRTWQAIKNNAYLVQKISGERIRDELNKMFLHPSRAQAVLDLSKSD